MSNTARKARAEKVFGPFATVGAAKGARTRETNGYYSAHKGRTDGVIEQSATQWTEVPE
jgi:hypothetical protein